jgi:kynureninase
MKQNMRGVGTGTVSLILIFAVLSLTIFAMLTLSTANAEKTFVTRAASFITNYYEADTQATRIKAHLIYAHTNGAFSDSLSEVEAAFNVEIEYEQLAGNNFHVAFVYEVNDFHDLSVKLRLAEDRTTVLEWRVVYSQPWEYDDTLPVWDGEFYEELNPTDL